MIYPLPGPTITTSTGPAVPRINLRLSNNTTLRARRDVRFGLRLDEASRERLDRLAARQGVSRTTIIARSLRLLESVQERGVGR